MYFVQILVYHLLMFAAVALLLWRLRSRYHATKKPTSFIALFTLCVWGAFSSLLLAVFVVLWSHDKLAGQRFAEGLFFEGAVFVGLAAREINRQYGTKTLLARLYLLFAILWCGVGLHSLYYEPWNLQVKQYVLETDKISKPLRIVLIADIQTDKIGDYERKALQLAKSQNGDLILHGGDYLQSYEDGYKIGRADLTRLFQDADMHAPLGVFAVNGNHEINNPGWETPIKNAGIDVELQSRSFLLTKGDDTIRLTLLSCEDCRSGSNPWYFSQEEAFHVMLGHDPSYAGGKTDADLLLAGHTHGGQVCIPGFGPIITLARGIPWSWGHGKTKLPDGSTLIISNGVGMERGDAPRIRFWCPPQIVVIDLVPR